MENSPLGEILLVLALSVPAIAILHRLHLPPILGYLFVGVVAGPYGLGWLPDSHLLHLLGEIGVVFLLFTIGLEFSIPQFLSMRGTVLGLGGAQVTLSTIAGGLLAWLLGVGWRGALVVGGALALSSTAIVVKQLTEQLEMHARHGRLALGILLFQDLAVVPFLVIIPILGQGAGDGLFVSLSWALLKGAAAFVVLLAVGRWVLRPLMHVVARAHSAELFTLAALLLSLSAAWITYSLGLSMILGAFLAGMLLGETEYRHQVEADIRPFRDVLLGLFFIAVGLRLDLGILGEIWHMALLLSLGLVVGKGLLVTALTLAGGYSAGVASRTGMVLAQGGEFGFALLALAIDERLLNAQHSQAILSSVVLSMALAPLLIRANGVVSRTLFKESYVRLMEREAQSVSSVAYRMQGHVILCGFGRIGQNVADFLRHLGVEYVALDVDALLIKRAWEAGEHVFYGDATHMEVLRAAGLERARAVVVTFDAPSAAKRVVEMIRQEDPDLPVLVRTRDDLHMEELEAAGATHVIPETMEASMMLATQLLEKLEVPVDDVLSLVERARENEYQSLRGIFRGAGPRFEASERPMKAHTVRLPPAAYAVGRRLGEMNLESMGITVKAVRRQGIRGDRPSPDMYLEAGDTVVLQGRPEDVERAEARLLRG